MAKLPRATLPVPSTALLADPTFYDPGGDAELRYEFDRDGAVVRGGFRFEQVRAFRFRAEGHCTVWHVDAYDTLVEVTPSDWVGELRAAQPAEARTNWEIHHFLIFIDGAGAYEVAAASWSWLPEQRQP